MMAGFSKPIDNLPKAEAANTTGQRLFLRQMATETAFDVPTPRDVVVKVIANQPATAKAGVVLLIGGTGVLSIGPDGRLDRSFNFASRSRDYWAEKGLATFLIDAPSDHLDRRGLTLTDRLGDDHRDDLKAVIEAIRQRFGKPLSLVGFSNGTVSAVQAYTAIGGAGLKGVVLMSPVTTGNKTVMEISSGTVATPVLAVTHEADSCKWSPPGGAALKPPSFDRLSVSGGAPVIGGDCGPFSMHSYFGIEREVIHKISEWISIQ